MVASAGAGPEPIPNKALNANNLAEGLTFCLTPKAQKAAEELGRKIRGEVRFLG